MFPTKWMLFFVIAFSCYISSAQNDIPKKTIKVSTKIVPAEPLEIPYDVQGTTIKRVAIDLNNLDQYGSLSMYANGELLADNLNVPASGNQRLAVLVRFKVLGTITLKLAVRDADMNIKQLTFEDVDNVDIPVYKDISIKAGLDKVNSIKYGGPTIADMDQDGDYDFIVNNHNEETSKLYWNNGDGTVTKHGKDLSRWFMQDLHGTAAADYDNDGDLDLILTKGGGNGNNPSKASFYKNDNSNLIRFTGDVGIDRGGRGRTARWSDMDLDGDLDFMLINETGLKKEKPQHFFYENIGDGSFRFKEVVGIQDTHQSRALVTDINGDHIDDIILYGPLSIWLGNGDFTFTDVSSQALEMVPEYNQVMALADIDIDNDGDLDLYLARGKEFENGKGEAPSLDVDPLQKEMAIKSRGFKGVDTFDFVAGDTIKLHNYYYLSQGGFKGEVYSIFLGDKKKEHQLSSGEELEFDSSIAKGWPDDISKNGLYFGYVGQNKWKAALVRNGDLFWSYRFSLSGVLDVTPNFEPQNRNEADVLLRNDNGVFTEVSTDWNLPSGGNSLGVTVGDFNNDSFQDIFVYRWGFIGSRTSDYMLLNTGKGQFETVTMHGANAVGGPGNGDMGQAFDFDLDGDLDLLNGSEGGQWYLYENELPGKGNSILVRVGYAPISNIDPLSATVVVETEGGTYQKRVGSAGEVFSQSLLQIVHFGLGKIERIERMTVRWRNGETVIIKDKPVNILLDTDSVDPENITVRTSENTIREGTLLPLEHTVSPSNANKNVIWSSSDTSILKVDDKGVVTALGAVGESAEISVKSAANGVSTTHRLIIVDWFAQPVEKLAIPQSLVLLEDQQHTVYPTITPTHADDKKISWSSSDPAVATVDSLGVITAIKAGEALITARTNAGLSATISLNVKPYIAPYVKILDKEKLGTLSTNGNLTVAVEYHAGSNNEVIHADEGGVRIWLRHFKNKWIPIKDVVLVDETALGTTTGKVTQRFSLEDYIPTSNLPEGQFYQLRVTFTSSDGTMYEDSVYPLNLVDKTH